MSKELFDSPREEALGIAYTARNEILTGKDDVLKTLRSCFVIANDLGKKEIVDWINQELCGYSNNQVPNYRIQSCIVVEYRRQPNPYQYYAAPSSCYYTHLSNDSAKKHYKLDCGTSGNFFPLRLAMTHNST